MDGNTPAMGINAQGAGAATNLARQRTRIWSVELHVEGLIWWHTWEGYAADSMDATALAIEDFHGRWGPPPEARRLQVKACLQRGV